MNIYISYSIEIPGVLSCLMRRFSVSLATQAWNDPYKNKSMDIFWPLLNLASVWKTGFSWDEIDRSVPAILACSNAYSRNQRPWFFRFLTKTSSNSVPLISRMEYFVVSSTLYLAFSLLKYKKVYIDLKVNIYAYHMTKVEKNKNICKIYLIQ